MFFLDCVKNNKDPSTHFKDGCLAAIFLLDSIENGEDPFSRGSKYPVVILSLLHQQYGSYA